VLKVTCEENLHNRSDNFQEQAELDYNIVFTICVRAPYFKDVALNSIFKILCVQFGFAYFYVAWPVRKFLGPAPLPTKGFLFNQWPSQPWPAPAGPLPPSPPVGLAPPLAENKPLFKPLCPPPLPLPPSLVWHFVAEGGRGSAGI